MKTHTFELFKQNYSYKYLAIIATATMKIFYYFRPLSMSENLTRLAQKIDFSKSDDEFCNIKKEGESSSDTKSEDDKEPGYQSSLWPWDSVRNKLRNALTEVSVLADVLSIAKEKRYMVSISLIYGNIVILIEYKLNPSYIINPVRIMTWRVIT